MVDMKPIRIQRKRTKGWKMPENTVYVGTPTKWGNPFKVGDLIELGFDDWDTVMSNYMAVDLYEKYKINDKFTKIIKKSLQEKISFAGVH